MSRSCCTLLLLLWMGKAAWSQQTSGTGLPLPNGLHALAAPGFPLVFSNPACRDSGFYFTTALTQLHGLRGLSHRFAGLAFDAGQLRWGMSMLQQGSAHYYRQQLGLSVANRIDRNTTLGLGLMAESIRQTGIYPHGPGLWLRAGFTTRIGRNTDLGMRLHTRMAVNRTATQALCWHLALGRAISGNLRLFTELEAQSGAGNGPAVIKTALWYSYSPKLQLMLGTGSRLRPFSFAFSWKQKRLLSSLAFDYHRLLGFTPQCILVWQAGS